MSTQATDETLYQKSLKGDMGAFEVLYSRYEEALFWYILRYVRRREDAEELFHEAFLRALKARPGQIQKGTFRAWLYRIARNLCLNWVDAQKRRSRLTERLQVEPREAVEQALELLELREQAAALEQALRGLPPDLAELYHLRVSGLCYEEIANVVEIPLGTVKSRMRKLVQVLNGTLARHGLV